MKKALSSLAVLVLTVMLSSLCWSFDLEGIAISEDTMNIHGYYEFEYWDAQHSNNTFDAHKLVIWMGKDLIKDKVSISSEFEYERFPRFDGEEKAGGSGEFKLDSAMARIIPQKTDTMETVITAGIFYVPFGIEWESYPGHKNKLITRPKLMKGGGIIPGTWSDVGLGVSHTHKMDTKAALLDLYVINGDAKHGGISRDSSEGGNENKSVGGRLSLKPLKGLNFGGSYVAGKYDEESELDTTRWGVHLRTDGKDLYNCPVESVIIAEVVGGSDEAASAVAGKDREVSGYYAQLALRPFKPLNFEKLELVGRYTSYDNDEEVSDNVKTETSIGLSYILYENIEKTDPDKREKALLKVEYQINDEEGTEVDNNAVIAALVLNW